MNSATASDNLFLYSILQAMLGAAVNIVIDDIYTNHYLLLVLRKRLAIPHEIEHRRYCHQDTKRY